MKNGVRTNERNNGVGGSGGGDGDSDGDGGYDSKINMWIVCIPGMCSCAGSK